jgi:hypothetical protein
MFHNLGALLLFCQDTIQQNKKSFWCCFFNGGDYNKFSEQNWLQRFPVDFSASMQTQSLSLLPFGGTQPNVFLMHNKNYFQKTEINFGSFFCVAKIFYSASSKTVFKAILPLFFYQ